MVLKDIDEVIDHYTGLSRKVLEYSQLMKRLVDAGKQPGFSEASWAPLAAMLDTDKFERVGNFKEVMDWPSYATFLTAWVKSDDWECSFKRVTESGNVVFLELEERSNTAGHISVVNSASVYEFDSAGKLCHLDIYLQMPLPDPAMLINYQDFKITG